MKRIILCALAAALLIPPGAAAAEEQAVTTTVKEASGVFGGTSDSSISVYAVLGNECYNLSFSILSDKWLTGCVLESAEEEGFSIQTCKYQIKAKRNGIINRGSVCNLLWSNYLVDSGGYVKKARISENGVQLSSETYRINDFALFEKRINDRYEELKDHITVLSSNSYYDFIPYYIRDMHPEITETTALSFTLNQGKSALDINRETADWNDFDEMPEPDRSDPVTDSGLYALSNGEFVQKYDYTTEIYPGQTLWYFQKPSLQFCDSSGSVTREFRLSDNDIITDKWLYSKVFDGVVYWGCVHVGSRMDYAPKYYVLYSDGDYSGYEGLEVDEWQITDIPAKLENGVTELTRQEYKAAYTADGVTNWLNYGGIYHMVEPEVPKTYRGAAGGYRILLSVYDGGCFYLTKDDVHFVKIDAEMSGINRCTFKLGRRKSDGEEYILWYQNGNAAEAQAIHLSEVDAAWEAEVKDSPVIILNNKILAYEESPYIEDGTTMIPIRYLFEKMGAAVKWDDSEKTAEITLDGKTVRLTYNSAEAYVNGEKYTVTKPVNIKDGRTYVPLRFISEALGYNVEWDNGVVYITDRETHCGDKIGTAVVNGKAVTVGGQPVDTAELNGEDYVMVTALDGHGYNVVCSREHKLITVSGSDEEVKETETPELTGDTNDAFKAYTEVYVNGIKADAVYINGGTYIRLSDPEKSSGF